MSQITLYLEPELDRQVTESARAHGVSKSRWVATVLQRHLRDTWPNGWFDLAGAFPDFPLRDESLASPQSADIERIGF